jgi:hypothetical protein
MKEEITDVYSFYYKMKQLIDSPDTDWKPLLGKELFDLLKPNYSKYKSVENTWVFDTSWNFIFNIMIALYFSPPEMGDKYNAAIERIIKEEE